jgi:hypothetical protein
LHRIEHWNGQLFEAAWLHQVGIQIHLGHGGNPCPSGGTHGHLDEGEHDWEDDRDPNTTDHPKGRDPWGNQYTVVADVSGIHTLAYRLCGCPNSPEAQYQFLELGFFPASYHTVKTVFTFAVLDDFLLDNLECKTASLAYFQKLRRLTNQPFPHLVPVSGI